MRKSVFTHFGVPCWYHDSEESDQPLNTSACMMNILLRMCMTFRSTILPQFIQEWLQILKKSSISFHRSNQCSNCTLLGSADRWEMGLVRADPYSDVIGPDWYNVLMVSDVPGNTFQIVSQLPQSKHTWKEWTRLICLSTNRENALSDHTQNNHESGSLKFNILFYTILRLVCFVCVIMWGHALHTSENTRWHLKKKPLRVTLCSHLFSLCITARQISKDFWNISLWMKNANHFRKSFFYFVVNFKTEWSWPSWVSTSRIWLWTALAVLGAMLMTSTTGPSGSWTRVTTTTSHHNCSRSDTVELLIWSTDLIHWQISHGILDTDMYDKHSSERLQCGSVKSVNNHAPTKASHIAQ